MPSRMCAEAELRRTPRRLVPARIEPDEAGIAGELEGALGAGRRHEAQDGDDAHAQARERRVDRERRAIGPDRVLEEHVEQRLVPRTASCPAAAADR